MKDIRKRQITVHLASKNAPDQCKLCRKVVSRFSYTHICTTEIRFYEDRLSNTHPDTATYNECRKIGRLFNAYAVTRGFKL